jgi:amidase
MTGTDMQVVDGRNVGNRCYDVGNDGREPLLWVQPGTQVCFHTLDASGNQITTATRAADELDSQAIFPITGPVGIDGIRPGDAVGVEVVAIRPSEKGHLWTRPGLGFGPAPDFVVREVDSQDLTIAAGKYRVQIPTRYMVGTIALDPISPFQARDLGAHGGNLDSPEVAPGATLWLRAQRVGGLVYAGDVHAAMGEAEVCGTGVEVPAEVHLRFHAVHDWAPPCPLVVNRKRVWLVGIGTSLEQALEDGLTHLTALLAEQTGASAADAYMTAAALLEVRICQVVNPHVSIAVSLSSGTDRLLVPERTFNLLESEDSEQEGGESG